MVDSDTKKPASAPAAASAEDSHRDDDQQQDDESTRQRIASIASRFGGLAAQASIQAAQKASDVATQASEQVSETVSPARNPTAAQTASVLQAMALTTKNAFRPSDHDRNAKSWYEYESPLHARRRIAEFESPLHARRRLAAIASQLGLATSSAKQAPGLLSALSSASSAASSSSSSASSRSTSPAKSKWDTARLPDYHELPAHGGWPGCAWDVWGAGDQLGTINLLTESLVLRAAKHEIQTGRTVSLNWPIHLPAEPFFARKSVTHQPFGKGGPGYTAPRDAYVASVREHRPDVLVRDDAAVPISDEMLQLNTQSGSQWDGLRHYGHLPLSVFYGGASRASVHETFKDESPQPADPEAWNSEAAKKRNQLGIHHLAQHGICGRGVLLDVFEYLSHHGTDSVQREEYKWSKWTAYGGGKGYDPRSGFRITVADLEATAKHQGVELCRGDILLVRSGFTARYYSLSPEERAEWSNPDPKHGMGMPFAGVEQSDEMKRFMWNHHFAAVAGDSPAFEARPTRHGEAMLHETFLAMWGMPIGELFDLELLAKTCKDHARWSFYFASWPLNLFGGVASTANASATF